jgi:adenosylhomocysteinase
MDMSFAGQSLSVEYMVKNAGDMSPGVYPVPRDLDMGVASLKLRSMGIDIDILSPDQKRYLESWEEGT